MPSKPKADYNISKIEALRNQGFSLRSIARKFGWNEANTAQWLARNYETIETQSRIIKYIKKEGCSGTGGDF